jgi:CRISPR-associated protein Csx3
MNANEHTANMSASITWSLSSHDNYTFAEFTITTSGGVLSAADLKSISVPHTAPMHKGIVFSGRGPVWLYGYLVHQAHCFAWVGIYDPRMQAAIVVERHTLTAPYVGDTITITTAQEA